LIEADPSVVADGALASATLAVSSSFAPLVSSDDLLLKSTIKI